MALALTRPGQALASILSLSLSPAICMDMRTATLTATQALGPVGVCHSSLGGGGVRGVDGMAWHGIVQCSAVDAPAWGLGGQPVAGKQRWSSG